MATIGKARIKDKRGNGVPGLLIARDSANMGKGVLECAGEDGCTKVDSGGAGVSGREGSIGC